jgi:hypothetical protein
MAMTEERLSGEVAGEAVGVGQREGAEGGFPALHGGAFDQPARGGALGGWQALLLRSLAGAFVLDVADGQPQQLDRRVVGGEVPPILDDLPELIVQRLDAYL